jgi:16S rRNA (guanine527-N7)-methyltransferase
MPGADQSEPPADVLAALGANVSRETLQDFALYLELLGRWQKRINLVSPNSQADGWRRHILDSAQLYPFLPPGPVRLADLGSGAGLPGLILALMLKGRDGAEVHLIESDARKCAFLREAARLTRAPVIIHRTRIEALAPAELGARPSVITARALKALPELLSLAYHFCGKDTRCLFLKGQDVGSELTEAHKYWSMTAKTAPSLSDPRGAIVIIEALSRV